MTLELSSAGVHRPDRAAGFNAADMSIPDHSASRTPVAGCWRCGARFDGVLHIVETASGTELRCLTCGAGNGAAG